jgi:CRISPR system Cascade subunit CasE
MYLAKYSINDSRKALVWISNPYRVHQRLMMAYDGEKRLLFRIEKQKSSTQILVQSHQEPNWSAAFDDFSVLSGTPQYKQYNPALRENGLYRFRLLANPVVTRDGKRQGIFKSDAQLDWLQRKFKEAGCELLGCIIQEGGFQRSSKNPAVETGLQTHFAVLFEGGLKVLDPEKALAAVENGIGPAKGYGFGLLSLATFHI